MATVTFRIPEHWAGRVNSKKVQYWLTEYIKHPTSLPPDPGAGDLRVSISVSAQLARILRSVRVGSVGAALRRIILANIDSPALASRVTPSRQTPPESIKESSKEMSTSGGATVDRRWSNVAAGAVPTESPLGRVTYLTAPGFPQLANKATADNLAISKFSTTNLGRHRTSVAVPVWVNWVKLIYILVIVAIIMWVAFRSRTKSS